MNNTYIETTEYNEEEIEYELINRDVTYINELYILTQNNI